MIDGKVATLNIVKAAPAQYLVEEGIAKNCGAYVAKFGKRALVSSGTRALAALGDEFFHSLEENQVKWQVNRFAGESSESNILRAMQAANECNADMIIGVGGGKSLDTAKVTAFELKIPLITVPTIAATCAAVTPLGIVYSDVGVYQRDYYPARNPDLVLVDTAVILKTPIEYLYSGILDALAKWYEGGAAYARAKNVDLFDDIAFQLARTLHDQMFAKAETAIWSVKHEKMSESLLDVVNLNIYLAGLVQSLGVKAFRNGIAHSVNNGLTVLK
jgi:glycerol dehydrogenase-like iron-containing ADH family enzyme